MSPWLSSGIFLHSLTGAVFVGRSHSPDLLQQLFAALGNMKNCGHEMHPPHISVITSSNESTELETERNTNLVLGYQLTKACRPQRSIGDLATGNYVDT